MTKKKPIEDLAQAAYEASNKGGGLQMPWAAQSESVRQKWRETAAQSQPGTEKKAKKG